MPTDEVTDDQRGYDRAIAEVVAWLREQAEKANTKAEEMVAANNDRGARDYFAGKISISRAATAIEAGEHKP